MPPILIGIDRAGPLLPEERIDHLQEESLHAAAGGLEIVASILTVPSNVSASLRRPYDPCKLHRRAGHARTELGERQVRVPQPERSAQLRDDVAGFLGRIEASRALAHAGQLLLRPRDR